jgi:hypothetical protein
MQHQQAQIAMLKQPTQPTARAAATVTAAMPTAMTTTKTATKTAAMSATAKTTLARLVHRETLGLGAAGAVLAHWMHRTNSFDDCHLSFSFVFDII